MKIEFSLDSRLSKYGSMSLALAAVSAPQAAKASVISFAATPPGLSDSAGPIFFNPLTGHIDLSPVTGDFELLTELQGSKESARLEVVNGVLLNAASKRNFAISSFGGGFSSLLSAARLNSGDVVGPALRFSSVVGTLASNSLHPSLGLRPFGHFNPVGGDASGFLGFEVLQGSRPEYGFANIVVHPDFSVTLRGFALQNDGSPITAEPVSTQSPEPASILLLALGAAGIAAYRAKRKA